MYVKVKDADGDFHYMYVKSSDNTDGKRRAFHFIYKREEKDSSEIINTTRVVTKKNFRREW